MWEDNILKQSIIINSAFKIQTSTTIDSQNYLNKIIIKCRLKILTPNKKDTFEHHAISKNIIINLINKNKN